MRAKYIGFQRGYGDIPGFDMFNIIAPGDPMDGTTVDEEQLNELGVDESKREYPSTGGKQNEPNNTG